VNVPKTLAQVRADSYQAYAWPAPLSGLFNRNGLAIALIAAASVAVFVIGFVALNDPAAVFSRSGGPGAFYALMPHNAMALIFSAAFLYAIVALAMGARNFWRDIAEPFAMLAEPRPLGQAIRDACALRYLDGGGDGCMNDEASRADHRRLYHHFAFYGFLLCFAATCVATLYHYLLAREAPYPWYDLPVVLGTVGGVGRLLIGPAGLLVARWRRDPELADEARFMDVAFIAMLFLTSVTGLALPMLRDTAAMGILLALHLGVVFALFITLPYGKFVHGNYRFLALVRYARERGATVPGHSEAG
jgi:citrate/tricarballylate utilization protein